MDRSRGIWKFVLCLCVMLLAAGLARAQYQASVQGTVLDPSGAAVAGATVTLTNQDTKVANTMTTTSVGFYHFSEVPPGTYTVTVEQTGFQKQTISDVAVSAETPRGLNVTLSVGQVAQTVTVNASATPELQTEESNIEGTLTNQEVERLPTFGRDPYELLRLSPGVLGDDARSGIGQSVGFPNGPGANGGTGGPGGSNTAIYQTENQEPISANGQRITSNDYMIDGVSVNSLQWGGAAVVTPSVESVQEISVLANDYDVADGRDSGAHIKVITKSGTDVFHGSTFFQYQTPGLNAYNKYNGYNFGTNTFDPTVRDENKYRQFGANLGGPIVKDKLFFFFNYEGLRDSNTVFSDQWVDTPQFRQLLISYSPNTPVATTLSDPGIAPRIQQVLPSSCVAFPVPCQVVSGGVNVGSPTGAYGTYLPNSQVQSGGGLTSVPEFEFAELYLPANTQGNQYNARVDYNLGRSVFSANMFLTQFNNFLRRCGRAGPADGRL